MLEQIGPVGVVEQILQCSVGGTLDDVHLVQLVLQVELGQQESDLVAVAGDREL